MPTKHTKTLYNMTFSDSSDERTYCLNILVGMSESLFLPICTKQCYLAWYAPRRRQRPQKLAKKTKIVYFRPKMTSLWPWRSVCLMSAHTCKCAWMFMRTICANKVWPGMIRPLSATPWPQEWKKWVLAPKTRYCRIFCTWKCAFWVRTSPKIFWVLNSEIKSHSWKSYPPPEMTSFRGGGNLFIILLFRTGLARTTTVPKFGPLVEHGRG